MIDWNKSAELNGMNVDDLKVYFDKYSQSNRKIISICDNCGMERNGAFQSYHNLCLKCSKNTDEARLANTLRQIQYNKDHPEKGDNHSRKMTEYWSDQVNRDAQSTRKLQYFIDNPEALEAMSETTLQFFVDHPEAREVARLKAIEQWSDPEAREDARLRMTEWFSDPKARESMSKIITNSDAAKANATNMKGGQDIIQHHYLYDDADLSKYTMPMTRSEHTAMHNGMRKDGYEVKHINSATDDNGLWGYN